MVKLEVKNIKKLIFIDHVFSFMRRMKNDPVYSSAQDYGKALLYMYYCVQGFIEHNLEKIN